jgi:sigma-E factor negative regulatory protein RseC
MNMSVESGVIESLENGWAYVLTRRKGACEGCGHRGHCHIVPGMDQARVKAKNAAEARVGDRVQFRLSSKTRLKGLFVMYIFPVLGLLVGAFSADTLSELLGLNRNLGLVVFTILGLALAVLLARLVGSRMESSQQLVPVVFRILQRAKPSQPTSR